MSVVALLVAFSIASKPGALPAGVLFSDNPATIEQMRTIEGRWMTSSNVPAFTLSPRRAGWMSFKAGKGMPDWIGRRRFPVAVTLNDGQLFVSMSVRSMATIWGIRKSYRGVQCYNTFAVMSFDDGIDIRSLDEDKMRAANRWYPEELPAWEGKQFSCGKFVRRAQAALNQRVVVILDPKSWFDGRLHRLRSKRGNTSGATHEPSR